MCACVTFVARALRSPSRTGQPLARPADSRQSASGKETKEMLEKHPGKSKPAMNFAVWIYFILHIHCSVITALPTGDFNEHR